MNDDAWHHVAVTWAYSGSGTTGIGKIYVDGVDDTAPATNYDAAHADNAGDTFKIGRPNYGNEAPKFFSGLMDEVTVHPRALADYEVANLHAYGLQSWVPATLDGKNWRYQVPDGDDGIEGLFQINVRGTDAAGNVTPQGGQRVWRGEIDTKPPSVSAPVTVTTAGSQVTTLFECNATDFSLVDATSCIAYWDPPNFRESDRSFTYYGDVNLWYGATFTETQRLYAIDATSVYTKETPVPDINVTACDQYNHCTTVPSDVHRVNVETLAATPLYPLPGDVLTSLDPILVRGHAFVPSGLAAMVVKIDGNGVHHQSWLAGTPVDEEWAFSWQPPGAGIYTVQPFMYDWSDYAPQFGTSMPADEPESAQAVSGGAAPAVDLPIVAYFPLVLGPVGPVDGIYRSYLPFVMTGIQDTDNVSGPVSTLYVDLGAPTVAIEPVLLTAEHKRGDHGVLLAGQVSDDVLVKKVEVSIDGSSWQLASIGEDETWRHIWFFDRAIDGETVEVRVRATDVAGRTTAATETLFVDVVAPAAGSAALFLLDELGQRQPVAENATQVNAATIGVEWGTAASDNPVTYEVGFSQQLRILPTELVSYETPGEATRSVVAGERWYATVRAVDDVGNADVIVLGPLSIGSGR